ncbi:YceI family protein [Tateyamaria armeniaca]|uniref:YceI family protein n=1 Tax=Tateyamaria armeniaca TaxID=2518930 RepID=A0ABW8UTY6_9RHOB
MKRRTVLAGALAALVLPTPGIARPYVLGPEGATISYIFQLGGTPVKGTVPIQRANLSIVANDLAASTADVTADVRRARTGLLLATEALKSPSVLAAAHFPLARFQSTKVTLGPTGQMSDGATLDGLLTLRGVTRSVRFNAQLFRKSGSAQDDLNRLTVILTGSVNRRDYGARGYGNLVDDTVQIEIKAQIETTL